MFPSETTLRIFDIALRVLGIALIYFIGWVGFFSPLVAWNKYKKNRDKEQKEAERIIVKMNKDIKDDTKVLTVLDEEIKHKRVVRDQLDQQIETKKVQISSMDLTVEEASEEKPLTVKELRVMARERGIKGFSKMRKAKLLELLAIDE